MNSPPTSTPHRKRKRAPSEAVINPLSHSPDTLRQFVLAGYPADKPLPSRAHPGFPHRGTSRPARKQLPTTTTTTAASSDDDDDDDDPTAAAAAAFRSTPASDADDDATATEGGWRTTDAETTDPESEPTTTTSSGNRRSRTRSRRGKHGNDTSTATTDRGARAYRARLGCLAAVVRRCLAEGDVARARRAFGLLVRARVYGRRVDLRRERFWEMGAEVLVREGEVGGGGRGGRVSRVRRGVGGRESDQGEGDGDEDGDGEGDWGQVVEGEGDGDGNVEDEEVKVERLARLKAYYEYLIQQYPYSKQHAGSAHNVLDFQVALFSAEMEAAHAANKRGLAKLQRGDSWEEEGSMDVDEPIEYGLEGMGEGELGGEQFETEPHLRGLSRRELKLREKENDVRLEALRRMTDIAQRMDTVMETIPFSRDHELLRLRAMVALYIGDLFMRPAPRSSSEDREGRRARADQRVKAKGLLSQIKSTGGLRDHDERLLATLDSDDEDDLEDADRSVLPMFSSMQV
ncbi:uncharacterized protein B0H64DRAFT_466997 [Chaetomium fimeti]|uniref:Uncharacterized protein n=1 Tax=Chaetomium fimeti TaxID=1854472 RepID=A0AAE0H975_9PEZI|nr:hypothetical protein B0H64DRAFT_466997 [Chaetomium fimeti]